MLRSRLGQCPRFSYVRPQVQAARRDLTLPIATRYPNGRLSYSTQPTRGLFSAKKEMEDASPEDRWNLQYAIEQGDRIGNTRIQSTTHRRALIIAPVYKDHDAAQTPGIKWMPTTTRDALLMHSTLTARGYDRANIRILSDGDNYGSASYPTRENIMESLKWLVASAQPGDYRFFHFSGHGVRRDSEKGKGKESRKVNEGQKPYFGDTERRLLPTASAKSRLSSQNIKAKELVYYNEALVAQISGGIHGEETQGPPYLIYDSELNAHFAKLPPGSNLTCVIDSCASARILNNNIKLAGGGFRGAESSGVGDTISRGIRGALDTVKGAFGLDDKIDMKEELPEEEWKMDKIQARMLTWGACHQRQDSVNYSDLRTGLFTRVWLEALQKDTDETPVKVGELFDNVSKETLEKAKGESNYWQYVQLVAHTLNLLAALDIERGRGYEYTAPGKYHARCMRAKLSLAYE